MAAAAPQPAYRIDRYDCGKDDAKLEILFRQVEEQQSRLEPQNPLKRVLRSTPRIPPFDPRVMPWIHKCDAHSDKIQLRHYVAIKPDGTIVGWLLAEKRRRFGYNYIYLSEITGIRYIHDDNKKIGESLHAALKKDATDPKEGIDFIYLYPLDARVKNLYESWGYRTAKQLGYQEELPQQFLLIVEKQAKKTSLPMKLLGKLQPASNSEIFTNALKVVEGLEKLELADAKLKGLEKSELPAAELKKDMLDRRRDFEKDDDAVRELRDALDLIAVFSEPDEKGEFVLKRHEIIGMLRDVFVDKPAVESAEAKPEPDPKRARTAGRRKTHRHRRHRKTRRRHK